MISGKLYYFRTTGKFYTEAKFKHNFSHMELLIDQIRELNDRNNLPGLSSGHWDGSILITEDHFGFPALLMPKTNTLETTINEQAAKERAKQMIKEWGLTPVIASEAFFTSHLIAHAANVNAELQGRLNNELAAERGTAEQPVVGVRYDGSPLYDADEVACWFRSGNIVTYKTESGQLRFVQDLGGPCASVGDVIAHLYLTPPAVPAETGLVWAEETDDCGNTCWRAPHPDSERESFYFVGPAAYINEIRFVSVLMPNSEDDQRAINVDGTWYDEDDGPYCPPSTPEAAKATCEKHWRSNR